MIPELYVPVPKILNVPSFKRFRKIVLEVNDISVQIPATLCPPNSTRFWPKTVGEVGDANVKELLKGADSAACGSFSPFPNHAYL
jgi:hypothetical protein